MSAEAQLFKIVDPATRKSEAMTEVDFAQLGFQERRDIQEWIAANPGILDEELLIVGKEFSGFDRTSERLDLLAVDKQGKLVVIELKRDDTGTDAHWQAIKYASYLHRAKQEDIIRMLASYQKESEEEAASRLLQHLGTDDFEILNNDQRIILASHRFAPEVTSAALWLNDKAPGDNLMTCVQLIPYRDAETESLYIQANTVIPIPGVDDYVIGVGDSSNGSGRIVRELSKLAQTFQRNSNDDVTRFLRRVAEWAIKDLPDRLKPDKQSRWAGQHYYDSRYYHLWYKRHPWGNWDIHYFIDLSREDEESQNIWRAELGLANWGNKIEDLENKLDGSPVHDDQSVASGKILVTRQGDALDDSFADTLAKAIRPFIEQITPLIDRLEDESNEEDA